MATGFASMGSAAHNEALRPLGTEKRLSASTASSEAGSTTGVGTRATFSSVSVCELDGGDTGDEKDRETGEQNGRFHGIPVMKWKGLSRALYILGRVLPLRSYKGKLVFAVLGLGALLACIRSVNPRPGPPVRRDKPAKPVAIAVATATARGFDFYLLALTVHAAFCSDGPRGIPGVPGARAAAAGHPRPVAGEPRAAHLSA